jgi:hypothetical protein
MSRWWRAYDEAVDDPKLILLTDKQFRAWFNLCCITSQNGGVLPDAAVIGIKLRVNKERARHIVAELAALGLIDIDKETGKFAPHNWNGRQFQSDVSTDRVKRFREQRRNVSATVSVTPPETETETETETDTEPDVSSELCSSENARERAPSLFDQFWSAYPHKVGKEAARKAFAAVSRSKRVTFAELSAGLDRYVRKTDDRPWCNPATWLNQGRWADEPAACATAPPRMTQADVDRQNWHRTLGKLDEFARSGSMAESGCGGPEVVRLLPVGKAIGG